MPPLSPVVAMLSDLFFKPENAAGFHSNSSFDLRR